MHSVLNRADRLEDLPATGEHDSPYVFETIFDDGSRRARRLSRKKLKLLRRIDEKLRAVLRDDERVRYVSFGSAIDEPRHFVTWLEYRVVNRRAIVLTDRRILLVHIDARMRPLRLADQLRYRAIHEVETGRTGGNVRLRLDDGEIRHLSAIPRADAELLRELPERIGSTGERTAAGLERLCPHCHAVVEDRAAECAACGGRFVSAWRATLESLVVPGLGDLRLGYWKTAIVKLAAAGFLWLGPFLSDLRGSATAGELLGFATGLVVIIHGAAAASTWSLARMGVFPARSSSADEHRSSRA